MTEKLLTAPEVAERLRIPLKTLYHWREKGYGPKAVKIGVRLLYRESDMDKWVDEQFAGDAA